jgi:hypothetical protein
MPTQQDQDSTQPQSDNPQAERLAQLEAQLREAAAAENFFETASGRLAVEIATIEINKLVQDICSDKYLKDHVGYVNAVSALRARKDWLRRLQVAKAPARVAKINERINHFENGE